MKSERLDGTWRGWLWAIGCLLIVFGSLMWVGFGLLQMGQLLGFAPSGMSLIANSALGLVAIGLFVLLVRAGTFPRT